MWFENMPTSTGFLLLRKSTIVAKQSMTHLIHECCKTSRKLTYKELYIFDFVNQVILSRIGMHPFMAYGVIHLGYA